MYYRKGVSNATTMLCRRPKRNDDIDLLTMKPPYMVVHGANIRVRPRVPLGPNLRDSSPINGSTTSLLMTKMYKACKLMLLPLGPPRQQPRFVSYTSDPTLRLKCLRRSVRSDGISKVAVAKRVSGSVTAVLARAIHRRLTWLPGSNTADEGMTMNSMRSSLHVGHPRSTPAWPGANDPRAASLLPPCFGVATGHPC